MSHIEAPEKVTHGRHCTCGACAREDWTNPMLACCGMHGASCPPTYQPLGMAGDVIGVSLCTCGHDREEHWATTGREGSFGGSACKLCWTCGTYTEVTQQKPNNAANRDEPPRHEKPVSATGTNLQ